jgi:hypothetical protein
VIRPDRRLFSAVRFTDFVSGLLPIPAMNRWAIFNRPLNADSGIANPSDESLGYFQSSANTDSGPANPSDESLGYFQSSANTDSGDVTFLSYSPDFLHLQDWA